MYIYDVLYESVQRLDYDFIYKYIIVLYFT